MNKTALIFLLLVVLSACGPVKESFVDVCTGEKIAGYDKTCKWRIGQTQRHEVTTEEMQEQKDRLVFHFSKWRGKALPTNLLIAVVGNEEMITTRGIKVGDPLDKVEEIYGKPWSRLADLGNAPGSDERILFYGLFYDNLIFLTDASFQKVQAIVIGNIPAPGMHRPWQAQPRLARAVRQ